MQELDNDCRSNPCQAKKKIKKARKVSQEEEEQQIPMWICTCSVSPWVLGSIILALYTTAADFRSNNQDVIEVQI